MGKKIYRVWKCDYFCFNKCLWLRIEIKYLNNQLIMNKFCLLLLFFAWLIWSEKTFMFPGPQRYQSYGHVYGSTNIRLISAYRRYLPVDNFV